MSEKKMKKLRKSIWGDESTRPETRRYKWDKEGEGACGGIKATGKRRMYKNMKKEGDY